jgi:glycosyltransferase involved in cell wall biosynthesis
MTSSAPRSSPSTPSSPRKPVWLAAVGDANDIRTWSGTPFHLLETARPEGVIDDGLGFEIFERFRQWRRYAWNIASLLRGRGRGGYQFSNACVERLWASDPRPLAGSRVINCFQLYPVSVLQNPAVERWYYIDQTMRQFFEGYGLRETIGDWIADDVLQRETFGYRHAAGIVTHSHWAAQSVVRDYGIAPERVHVIVPGANLADADYRQWAEGRKPPQTAASGPLKLVFVGTNPQRKGLDRLLRAFVLARHAGADCSLMVIGSLPETVDAPRRAVPGVEWRGFIDKRRALREFMDTVAACDVGCLLSRAEAGGIGLREYHALGLAVLGPDVGGSPDHVLREASELIAPGASDEAIAERLLVLSRDRARIQHWRSISWQQREAVSWRRSVAQFAQLPGWGAP